MSADEKFDEVVAVRLTFRAFSDLPETHLAEMRMSGVEPVTRSVWEFVTADELGIDVVPPIGVEYAIAEKLFEVTNRQDSKLFERLLRKFPENRTHTSMSCSSLGETGDLVEIAWLNEDDTVSVIGLRCARFGFEPEGVPVTMSGLMFRVRHRLSERRRGWEESESLVTP